MDLRQTSLDILKIYKTALIRIKYNEPTADAFASIDYSMFLLDKIEELVSTVTDVDSATAAKIQHQMFTHINT